MLNLDSCQAFFSLLFLIHSLLYLGHFYAMWSNAVHFPVLIPMAAGRNRSVACHNMECHSCATAGHLKSYLKSNKMVSFPNPPDPFSIV